jgi:hypothetical protein
MSHFLSDIYMISLLNSEFDLNRKVLVGTMNIEVVNFEMNEKKIFLDIIWIHMSAWRIIIILYIT